MLAKWQILSCDKNTKNTDSSGVYMGESCFTNFNYEYVTLRPSAHGATEKKLIAHANYQPVTL
jgi:hypothetical protein